MCYLLAISYHYYNQNPMQSYCDIKICINILALLSSAHSCFLSGTQTWIEQQQLELCNLNVLKHCQSSEQRCWTSLTPGSQTCTRSLLSASWRLPFPRLPFPRLPFPWFPGTIWKLICTHTHNCTHILHTCEENCSSVDIAIFVTPAQIHSVKLKTLISVVIGQEVNSAY